MNIFLKFSQILEAKEHSRELALCAVFLLLALLMPYGRAYEFLAAFVFAPVAVAFVASLKDTRFYKIGFYWVIVLLAATAVFAAKGYDLLAHRYFQTLYAVFCVAAIFAPFGGDDTRLLRLALIRLRAVLFALIAFVVAIGLFASLVWCFYYLFGVKIFKEFIVWRAVWFCVFAVSAPVFLIYIKDERLKFGKFSRMSFAALFAALFIYTLMLYAYAVYIALNFDLPRQSLSVIVLPYLFLGVVGFCLRLLFDEVKFERFYRYFGLISIVPAILLFVGIFKRVGEYGWTEFRAYLFEVSVLAVFLAVCCIFKQIKFRSFALVAILALFISGVVIDAKKIGKESQFARFNSGLRSLNLLDESGKFRADAAKIYENFSDSQIRKFDELYDIASYLGIDTNRLYGGSLHKIQRLGDKTRQSSRYDLALKPMMAAKFTGDSEILFLSAAVYHDKSGVDIAVYDDENEIVKFDGQEHLEAVFKENEMDISVKYSNEQISKIADDLLAVRVKDGVIFMTGFSFKYDEANGKNIFDTAENLFFIKNLNLQTK